MKTIKKFVLIGFMLINNVLLAQQWNGSSSTTGIINREGNVGIGTTAPSSKLHIVGGSGVNADISLEKSSASEEAGISFKRSGAYMFFIYSDNADGEGLKIQDATEPDATPRIHVPYGNKNLYLVQSGGNVGIGTSTPTQKLQVVGSMRLGELANALYVGKGNDLVAGGEAKDLALRSESGNVLFAGAGTERMRLSNSGDLGIGTTAPQARLHVEGSQVVTGNMQVGAKHDAMGYGTRLDLGASGNWDPIWMARYNYGEDVSELRLNIGDDGGDRFTIGHQHYSDGEWRPAVSVTSAGQMSIGTMAVPSGYKLAVGGNIIAEKVRVQLQPWADYVFEPTYKLPSLREVEAFIQQNKHLPDVPSAKEVEANGLDLGENQALLLKKIEELTLYVIEQDKHLANQQKEIEQLRKQNNDINVLKEAIQRLEQKLAK